MHAILIPLLCGPIQESANRRPSIHANRHCSWHKCKRPPRPLMKREASIVLRVAHRLPDGWVYWVRDICLLSFLLQDCVVLPTLVPQPLGRWSNKLQILRGGFCNHGVTIHNNGVAGAIGDTTCESMYLVLKVQKVCAIQLHKKTMVIGWNREIPHPNSNCKSQRFLFQVS